MKPIYLEKSLGIDIREGSISLVLLGKKWNSIDILANRFLKTSPLTQGDEASETAFLEEINKFLMENEFSYNNIVVGLPRNQISFQTFMLPAPDENVIESMMEFEIERHFFSKPDQLHYSYQAIRKSENQFQINLTATRRDLVSYYLDLLKRLNLVPTIVDSTTFNNLNLLPDIDNANGLEAIVDVSPTHVEINLIRNKTLLTSRNLALEDESIKSSYFNEDLTEEIRDQESGKLAKIIMEELINTLSACHLVETDEEIERVHLINGGPFADPLVQQLAEITETPTASANTDYEFGSTADIEVPASYYTAALGLAARELITTSLETNLLPPAMRPKRKKANLKTTLVLAGIGVMFLVGFFVSNIVYKSSVLASLNVQLKDVKSQVSPYENIDHEGGEIQQYLDVIEKIESIYPNKLLVLEELTEIIPPNTWLSDILFKKDQIEIKGFSSKASALIPLIEKSPYFKDTAFSGTILKRPEGERFTIKSNYTGYKDEGA